jgi:hypothetical protein
MQLTGLDQVLLDMAVPISLCRLVMNLVHSNREDCNEDSFDTLKDVASELNEIINLRPKELFYDTEPANHKVLVYDKAIFGREREVHQIT